MLALLAASDVRHHHQPCPDELGFASATVTAHDFRATASTWLHEMGLRSDFIELQLAHVEATACVRHTTTPTISLSAPR